MPSRVQGYGPAPRTAGQEVGGGGAVDDPVTRLGEAIRIGHPGEGRRKLLRRGSTEPPLRQSAQPRRLLLDTALDALLDALLDTLLANIRFPAIDRVRQHRACLLVVMTPWRSGGESTWRDQWPIPRSTRSKRQASVIRRSRPV